MTKETKKKFKFRFPLWAKALAVLLLTVFIVSGAAINFFSTSISNMTRNHYIEHSIELADTLGIYLDITSVKNLKVKVIDSIYNNIPESEKVENSSWGEPEWETYLENYSVLLDDVDYLKIMEQLAEFHSKNDVKFTCLVYADLTNYRIVYLADDSDLDDRCLPGSFDDFTETDMTVVDHLADGFTPEITNMPEYGYLASVARPIFDGEKDPNNIVAFALVDLSMDDIIAKEGSNTRELTILLISLSAGAVLVGFLLVLFLIARPVRILTKAANDYTKGDDQELNKFEKIRIRTKDEIEDLSISMKKMEKDINHYIVDILDANKKASEMKQLADRDALTGMNNKRSYFEIEERINEEIKQGKAKYAITMIDLNDLKGINDNLGHEKGDEAIVSLSNLIKETFKHSETYRIGGDEFAAVSENEDLNNIQKLEKDLREKIKTKANGISAAIGVAIFDPKTDNNFEDTFKRADSKMYQNKKAMKK